MFIRSERLFLRPLWPEERAELLGLIEETANVCGLVAALGLGCENAADDAPALPDNRHLRFVITFPLDDREALIVGAIGLTDGEDGQLKCWIAPAFRGRGFAAESGRAVTSLLAALGHGTIAPCPGCDDVAATPASDAIGPEPGKARDLATRGRSTAKSLMAA